MARGKSAKSKSKAKTGRRGKSAPKADPKIQLKAHRKPARGNDVLSAANQIWAYCTRLPAILTFGVVLGFCIGLTVAEIDELRRGRGPAIAAPEEEPATQTAANEAFEAPQPDLVDQAAPETAPATEEPASPETTDAAPVPQPLYTEETEPDAAPDSPIPMPEPEVAAAEQPPVSPEAAPATAPAAQEPAAPSVTPAPVAEPPVQSATAQPAPEPAPAEEPGPELASMPPAPEPVPPPAAPLAAPKEQPALVLAPEPPPEPEVASAAGPVPDLTIEPSADAPIDSVPLTAAPVPENAPTWLKNAVASIDPGQHPMIAIVLDDVGVAPSDAELALKLPSPVTLSIMTYAPNVATLAKRARTGGHEIMVHMPMEPVDHSVDPGPNALLVGLTEAEIRRRVIWGLTRFDGFVGINNHMGSRFTQYEPGMRIVMEELKARGLLFLDSRTIAKSVGEATAAEEGVTHITRDVFLDNTMSVDAVLKQLKDAEAVARAQGYVVAIGHPHPTTVAALKRWIPEARKAGFVLVPLSEIVKKREGLAG